MTGTRRFAFVLTALALAVLLYQPLCRAAHPNGHPASPAATCCVDIGAPKGVAAADLAIDTGSKPLVAPVALAYFAATEMSHAAAPRWSLAPPPPRSFYARSARVRR